jgi:hypothetical protein
MVMAAVGDSIRSEIGKPKRKRRSSDRQEKDFRAAKSMDRRTNPRSGRMAPGGDHGGQPPGGGAVRKRGRRWLGFGPV